MVSSSSVYLKKLKPKENIIEIKPLRPEAAVVMKTSFKTV
jgi:hypothetical protein